MKIRLGKGSRSIEWAGSLKPLGQRIEDGLHTTGCSLYNSIVFMAKLCVVLTLVYVACEILWTLERHNKWLRIQAYLEMERLETDRDKQLMIGEKKAGLVRELTDDDSSPGATVRSFFRKEANSEKY